MKNCICLSSVCLLILFAIASSLGQKVEPQSASGSFEPRFPQKPCPVVSVSGPSELDIDGLIPFTTTLSNSNYSAKLTYNWEVSRGVITEGQGTSAIVVKASKYQTVTATVDVRGLDPSCGRIASATMGIHHPFPPEQKFDFYRVLPRDQEEAILERFATALKNQPGAKAYILGYDGRVLRGSAQKSVDRARTYLVDKHGIDQARIVTVDVGAKEQLTIDLYLVPIESIPAGGESTLYPTEAKPGKSTETKSSKRP